MSDTRMAREALQGVTAILLDRAASELDLAAAAGELHALLAEPLRGHPALAQRSGAVLPEGTAISPFDASECTRDPVRTALFLRGVRAALFEAIERFVGEVIEVVYAGTGPLAPLAMALLPSLGDAPVRFTLLDAHETSVDAVRIVGDHFGVTGQIAAALVGDATRYIHPRRLHVVITETMQRALQHEPQVAITRQLAPQLVQGGVLVPERVRVDLVVREVGADGLVRIDPELLSAPLLAVDTRISELPVSDGCLPPVCVTMPNSVPPTARAMYRTVIDIDREHVIEEFASGLTHPLVIWDLAITPGEVIEFRYRLGSAPGFVWQRAGGANAAATIRDDRGRDE